MKRGKNTKKKKPKRVAVDFMHASIRWIALDIMIRHTVYIMKSNRVERYRKDLMIRKWHPRRLRLGQE